MLLRVEPLPAVVTKLGYLSYRIRTSRLNSPIREVNAWRLLYILLLSKEHCQGRAASYCLFYPSWREPFFNSNLPREWPTAREISQDGFLQYIVRWSENSGGNWGCYKLERKKRNEGGIIMKIQSTDLLYSVQQPARQHCYWHHHGPGWYLAVLPGIHELHYHRYICHLIRSG